MTVGKHLEGEDHSQRAALPAQFTKHQLRAGEGILQKLFRAVARPLQQSAAEVEAQDEDGKYKLQDESQAHRLEPDGATVAGKQISQAQHGGQAQKPCQTAHSCLPFMHCETSVPQAPEPWR